MDLTNLLVVIFAAAVIFALVILANDPPDGLA